MISYRSRCQEIYTLHVDDKAAGFPSCQTGLQVVSGLWQGSTPERQWNSLTVLARDSGVEYRQQWGKEGVEESRPSSSIDSVLKQIGSWRSVFRFRS